MLVGIDCDAAERSTPPIPCTRHKQRCFLARDRELISELNPDKPKRRISVYKRVLQPNSALYPVSNVSAGSPIVEAWLSDLPTPARITPDYPIRKTTDLAGREGKTVWRQEGKTEEKSVRH